MASFWVSLGTDIFSVKASSQAAPYTFARIARIDAAIQGRGHARMITGAGLFDRATDPDPMGDLASDRAAPRPSSLDRALSGVWRECFSRYFPILFQPFHSVALIYKLLGSTAVFLSGQYYS